MGYPVTANRMVEGGERWIIGADGTLEFEAGATVEGLDSAATFASEAEAIAGVVNNKNISPATLKAAAASHVPDAATNAKGKVELATDGETIAVTDAVRAITPHGLGAALTKLFVISFTGSNLAGACTATGAAVNDVILGITGLTDMGLVAAKFETTVTVNDQIQQSAAENLSAKNFLALVYRPS